MAVIKTKPPQFKKYSHLIKKSKKDGIMKKLTDMPTVS